MAEISYKAKWARRVVREELFKELIARGGNDRENFLPGFVGGIPILQDALHLPEDDSPISVEDDSRTSVSEAIPPSDELWPELKLCIVGAGVAGLYIAMILDSLEIPNLTYEILESSDRIGGRIYTHHFSPDEHQYYDIGAMRFPVIPSMERTFDLFKRVGVDKKQIPYVYGIDDGSVRTPNYFNDNRYVGLRGIPPPIDVYRISVTDGGLVPDVDVGKGVDTILEDVFGKWKKCLHNNWETGFKNLMQEVDELSTREYIRTKTEYGNFYTIQWLETMNSASGLYDQAFSESVIDSFDFDDIKNWVCLEGGTSLVIDGMLAKIEKKPETKKRVTAISINRSDSAHPNSNMVVQVAGEEKPRNYSTVFNTTTLACMQRMDLRGAELHPVHKDAIRCLHYDASSKVAIQFKNPWWITKVGITNGGTSSTDYPIRTCVYPSYNLTDNPLHPAVLLCSYTWAQDAQRVGGLIGADGHGINEELLELVLKDLAILHEDVITYKELKENVKEYHAWDWYADPNSSGAFALFAPGQFSRLYPILCRPTADANLHFAGEAASSHHAWVVGALNSAWRAVFNFLKKYQAQKDSMSSRWAAKIRLLIEIWGIIDEMEIDSLGTAHLQVMLGRVKPENQVKV